MLHISKKIPFAGMIKKVYSQCKETLHRVHSSNSHNLLYIKYLNTLARLMFRFRRK